MQSVDRSVCTPRIDALELRTNSSKLMDLKLSEVSVGAPNAHRGDTSDVGDVGYIRQQVPPQQSTSVPSGGGGGGGDEAFHSSVSDSNSKSFIDCFTKHSCFFAIS